MQYKLASSRDLNETSSQKPFTAYRINSSNWKPAYIE